MIVVLLLILFLKSVLYLVQRTIHLMKHFFVVCKTDSNTERINNYSYNEFVAIVCSFVWECLHD